MSAPDRPFHVLMSPSTGDSSRPHDGTNNPGIMLDPRIQSDYLARRYEATNNVEPQTNVWSAASSIERALVECCELDGDESLEVVVEGALMLKKVIVFVELLTRHCYQPTLRILVITILERTLEQDELNLQEETEENEKGRDPPPNCMSRFLAAGGLKILNEWLQDAITPVEGSSQGTTSTGTSITTKAPATKKQKVSSGKGLSDTTIMTSPHGPLLLPLLSIMQKIPLDMQLVKKTRVIKTIKTLKRQIEELPKRSPHPLAGGCVVSDVLKAMELLMETWNKDKNNNNTSGDDDTAAVTTTAAAVRVPPAKDPLRRLKATMKDRLQALQDYDAGKADKPDWLEQFEEDERLEKERIAISKMTPTELERKRFLEEIQRKKLEAETKIGELKKKQEAEIPKIKPKGPKKSLSWKDGRNNGPGRRMEEVFNYTVYIDVDDAEDDVEAGTQEDDDDDEDMWI